jgi:glycosyltransferase involved in cell wall biosynthesis
MQSLNILPSGLDWRLSSRRFQLVHLHWVNNELLSIPEIGRIDAPMVWTLHDMWAFCGTEHYMSDPSAYLGVVGTRPSAGPSQLARWNWERKRRWWAGVRPILVAPSNWLADLVRQSRLLGQCRVEVVPYGLDLNRFSPAAAASHSGKRSLRVVFGAAGGSQDHRKGFDLLIPAVRRLAAMLPESCLELLVFGEAATPSFDPLPSSVSLSSAGVIDSEEAMSKLLASADIFVAPSRQDNLPNTVLEATACGVPTVAFRVGGMPDMIEHQVSGYLATPYEAEDLAAGMAWALHDSTRLDRLKQAARAKAEREFGSDRQADRMLAIYDDAIRASR